MNAEREREILGIRKLGFPKQIWSKLIYFSTRVIIIESLV